MQMRSAEGATPSTTGQDAQPSTPQDAKLPPNDERPAIQGNSGAVADQDTTIFSAPDDPFTNSGVTMPPNRAQGPAAREQAAQAPVYVPPPVPRPEAVDPDATTSLTFRPNTAAGVSYLFLWISGVLIFFNERRNRYVRFHAL